MYMYMHGTPWFSKSMHYYGACIDQILLSRVNNIDVIMPWWAEPRRHTVVVLFVRLCMCVCVCVCVCAILQRAFLHDGKELSNEICNATTA